MTITMRQAFYRLGDDGRTPVPCAMQEWGAWRQAVAGTTAQLVAEDRLANGWRILTIFTGLDQRLRPECAGAEHPLLFLTRAWTRGRHTTEYTSSRAEAEAVHAARVASCAAASSAHTPGDVSDGAGSDDGPVEHRPGDDPAGGV